MDKIVVVHELDFAMKRALSGQTTTKLEDKCSLKFGTERVKRSKHHFISDAAQSYKYVCDLYA